MEKKKITSHPAYPDELFRANFLKKTIIFPICNSSVMEAKLRKRIKSLRIKIRTDF